MDGQYNTLLLLPVLLLHLGQGKSDAINSGSCHVCKQTNEQTTSSFQKHHDTPFLNLNWINCLSGRAVAKEDRRQTEMRLQDITIQQDGQYQFRH